MSSRAPSWSFYNHQSSLVQSKELCDIAHRFLMANDSSLESLQDLHRDLQALSASRLPIVDRLWLQLEARIEDFRNLLDQKRKDDKSREKLLSGTITIDDAEYSVNQDFREQTLQLAHTLDLDEIESAKLFLAATKDSAELDRQPFVGAVIKFQQRREFMLECLRLAIKLSREEEVEEFVAERLKIFKNEVYEAQDGAIEKTSRFWTKSLFAMAEIEKRLQDIANRYIKVSMTDPTPSTEMEELMKLETASLTRQHESLAGICCYMIKDGVSAIENFRSVQEAVKRLDKHDAILIHYIPILSLLIGRLGPSYAACTLRDAGSLHTSIVSANESGSWAVRNFQSAVTIWWLAEYSGRYVENPVGSPLQGVDLEAEADERSKTFMSSVKDGAFHFMLSVCQDLRPDRWYDPARAGLVSFLLKDSATLPADTVPFSEDFQLLVMEEFQGFTDAFISNMPDTLRKLKVEEDEQRRQLQSRFQREHIEYELHLERFLIIICFAYDGSPEAGISFWNEPDGNLYGFLQWAAKRQTTPRVAAFCEMLRAIAVGEECAEAAHRFLQEEAPQSSSRLRRTTSLSYSQIFAELQFYSTSVRDKFGAAPGQVQQTPQNPADQIVEPESAMMLESYLRLLAHLCSQSTAAREWVLQYPNIVPMLLSLCQSNLESRLRASTFSALTSFLTHKTTAIGYPMWNYVDTWLHTGFNVPSKQGAPQRSYEEFVWNTVASGYEESNAFIELLKSLIAPSIDDSGLNDALPFPENLGSNHRMPGIENYVDFVVGRVFVEKLQGLQPLQLRVMRWNCLKFISTCLSSFNEDLVILANISNTDVDLAIQSTSLAAYVQLHPFARIMEWLFNDRVLTALFETAHQDVNEVNVALDDSPLVLSILSSVEVMNQIMSLQSTYLDIVRPLIKLQSATRKAPVSNATIASFEDAVYTNLSLMVDLGLYCGTGHQDLTIASLKLLEKLSSSKKLNGPANGFSLRSDRNKIIGIVEKDNDSERIARALVSEMQVDAREVAAGPETSGYIIKTTILDFLNGCLGLSPDRPSLAHILLGFTIVENQLDISENGLFARGGSLFHAVLRIATFYPDEVDGVFLPWLTTIKQSCFDVLQRLWRSPLSSLITMSELRTNKFLYDALLRQKVISPETLWNGLSVFDDNFYVEDGPLACQSFLRIRSAIYDYAGREFRSVSQGGMSSTKANSQLALLGSTPLPNGEIIRNPSIFDLFDFMELLSSTPLLSTESMAMKEVNYEVCRAGPTGKYNIPSAAQLITLHRNLLGASGQLVSLEQEQKFQLDGQNDLSRLHGINQEQNVIHVQKEVLRSWVKTVTILLENGDFDDLGRTNYVLQILQLIAPKIENSYEKDHTVAIELLQLSKTLLQHVNFASPAFQDNTAGEFTNDRMFQLFKISLSGIYATVADPLLREVCYQICYRYQLGASSKQKQLQKYIIQAVESAGDNYLEILCEDAYSGHGTCRVSALLFLEALVSLSLRERSRHVMERLIRFNFIALCVDSIKAMPADLRGASAADMPLLLSYYEASLSLILRVSQARDGAAHVLNTGLFQSIRDSQIFSADPDIGLEFENPRALSKYFDLMLSILRVINAVVLSRGPQNNHTISQAREFLKENRQTMVAIFKRHAHIGGIQMETGIDLDDLLDNFTLLITATNFLDYEEEQTQQKTPQNIYS